MKKIAVLLAAVAATFASCQKPVLDEPVEVKDTFTAFVEEFDSPTKTSMNSNKQQLWSAGDELAIFRGNLVADEYKLADECAGTTSGIFKSVSGGAAGTAVPCNVAYYPYAKGQSLKATEAGYELSVELPETQLYAQNSYGVGAFPMVAVTTDVNDRVLKFKNVAGAMNLQFKGTQKVVSVKVEGNAGEALSGAAVVTADDTPSVKMQSAEATAVVLDCGEGVQLSETEATSFILALPPVELAEGFTVTILDADNLVYTVVSDAKNEILRSGILVMPEVNLAEVEGVPAPEPEPDQELSAVWQIAGAFNGWSPTYMVIEGDYCVVKNVTGLNYVQKADSNESGNGFKFLENGAWKGCGNNGKVSASAWEYVWNDGGLNIYVDGAAETDAFDVYLNSIAEGEAKFVIVPAGTPVPEDAPSGDDNTGDDNTGSASTGWALPGGYNGWSTTSGFLSDEGAYYVAKNVTVMSGAEPGFKFQHAEFGWKGVGATTALAVGQWHKLNGDNNITLSGENVAYDVYMTLDGSQFQAVLAGSPVPEAPVVVADYWALIGSFTSWADEIKLAAEGEYLVAKGVTISTTDEFKFRKNGDWNAGQRIAKGGLAATDTEYDFVDAGSGNMKVSAAGTYDVYVKSDLSKVYFMTAGKTPAQATQPDASNVYRFYVQNNVGWTTLYFYAWGGYASASWPGDKMTASATVEGYGECKYIEITKGVSVVNFIVNDGANQPKQTKDLKVSGNSKVKQLANGDYVYVFTSADVK